MHASNLSLLKLWLLLSRSGGLEWCCCSWSWEREIATQKQAQSRKTIENIFRDTKVWSFHHTRVLASTWSKKQASFKIVDSFLPSSCPSLGSHSPFRSTRSLVFGFCSWIDRMASMDSPNPKQYNYNLNNPSIKRIMKEMKEMERETNSQFSAAPLEVHLS